MRWWRTARRLATGSGAFGPPSATADYYLLGGIGDLVADGAPTPARPIARMGPNTWTHGDRLIVVRYVTEAEAEAVEARQWRSVHYVVDDLLPAVSTSVELPDDYRTRLTAFVTDLMPCVLALRPVIVAPSLRILEAFPGFEGTLLDPCCLALRDGPLPTPTPCQGQLEIAFLGTRSHLGSLPLLAAVAEHLDRSKTGARLHLYFGRHLPRDMRGLRALVNHEPVSWPHYASFRRRARFHAALAPVQATPFAMARSITKLMDHAAVGAAGLYGERPPFAGVVTHGRDGMLMSDDPAAWADALRSLSADPGCLSALAAQGGELAARLGDPLRVRRFWLDALAVDPTLA